MALSPGPGGLARDDIRWPVTSEVPLHPWQSVEGAVIAGLVLVPWG